MLADTKLPNVDENKAKNVLITCYDSKMRNPIHIGTLLLYRKYNPIFGEIKHFHYLKFSKNKTIFFIAIKCILDAIHMLKPGYKAREKYNYDFCSPTPHKWGSPLRKTDNILQLFSSESCLSWDVALKQPASPATVKLWISSLAPWGQVMTAEPLNALPPKPRNRGHPIHITLGKNYEDRFLKRNELYL